MARHAGSRTSISVDNFNLLGVRTLGFDALLDFRILKNLIVEDDAVVVRRLRNAVRRRTRLARRCGEEGQVERGSLGRRLVDLRKQIVAADDFVKRPVAHGRENLTDFLRGVHEEVDKVARRAREARAKLFTLGRNTNRAVVRVANARHDTTRGNHRNSTEAVLIRSHERSLDDVKTRSAATVRAQNDAFAETILDKSSVRLNETHLQRTTAVLDGRQRRRTSTTITTRNLNDIGVRLGDTRCDSTDASLSHELHGHLGLLIDHVQIVDELREILNGVNVVVRRRRNERDTSLGASKPSNVRRNLLTRKLTTFTRLGTLRNLNFSLVGRHQERGGDTEAARGNLLDSRGCNVTVLHTAEVREGFRLAVRSGIGDLFEALGVFTTFTRVGLAADTVHGNGDGFVALLGDGTKRHTTGAEARADVGDRFNFVDGDRRAVRLDFKLVTQARVRTIVAVRLVGAPELVVLFATAEANSLVEKLGHLLVVAVVFETRLDLEHTTRFNLGHLLSLTWEGRLNEHMRLRSDFVHGETTDARHRTLESGVDDFGTKTVAFENLRALVRRD